MMTFMTRSIRLSALLLTMLTASAQNRQVAITIDDVPRGEDGGPYTFDGMRSMTARLLTPFREQKIPVTGFVNAGIASDGLRRILDLWLDAGAELGNHANTHLDINNVSLETYTADIAKGEPAIRDALSARGKTLAYYRHPYLHTGSTTAIKKGMQDFLDQHGYRVAPVTLSNADYDFAALYNQATSRERVKQAYVPYMESIVAFFEKRAVEVVGREIPQILLIHANQLNADLMPELLAMFRSRGYSFVSLDQALSDEAYRLPDDYVGSSGLSWISRWSKTKGMPDRNGPAPPAWVAGALAGASK
jgi:peptidoglycan/xylan/chitin deacetylase (PgdA/CDA1 family)